MPDAFAQPVGNATDHVAAIAVPHQHASIERLELDQPHHVFDMGTQRDLRRQQMPSIGAASKRWCKNTMAQLRKPAGNFGPAPSTMPGAMNQNVVSHDATRLKRDQIASSPTSPVRMRTTSSTLDTKILPSPIRPVRAARTMPSIARSTTASPTMTSTCTLGKKSTTYSAPR